MKLIYVLLSVSLALTGLTSGCAPVLVGAGVGASVIVAEDRRSSATMLEDKTIEIKATRRINEQLGDQSKIKVASFNRFVLLVGQVSSEEIKERASLLTLAVPTVRNVENKTTVSGRNSLVSKTNDNLLSIKVRANLIKNKDINANHIKVTADSGTIYLMGLVTKKEGDVSANVTAGTSGVQKVVKVFEYID